MTSLIHPVRKLYIMKRLIEFSVQIRVNCIPNFLYYPLRKGFVLAHLISLQRPRKILLISPDSSTQYITYTDACVYLYVSVLAFLFICLYIYSSVYTEEKNIAKNKFTDISIAQSIRKKTLQKISLLEGKTTVSKSFYFHLDICMDLIFVLDSAFGLFFD